MGTAPSATTSDPASTATADGMVSAPNAQLVAIERIRPSLSGRKFTPPSVAEVPRLSSGRV